MRYVFEGGWLDTATRELQRGGEIVAVEPQVFDLLQFLIEHRARVVGKDELISEVWNGRIVSDSTLSSRVTAVRQAIGDSGQAQRLVRTIPRKGLRFVGTVREALSEEYPTQQTSPASHDRPLHGDGPTADTSARGEASVAAIAESRPAAQAPNAERRYLTIVACELVIDDARHLDPEDLRERIALYYRVLTECAGNAAGFVARYAGPSVLIYFGYPTANENDAERAVRMALDAVSRIPVSGTIGHRMHARAGIDTGLVVVGPLDDAIDATGPTAIGDPPQVAARLASVASQDEVVISATTRALIGSLFECRRLAPIELQGLRSSIDAARVLRESRVASRFEALRSSRAAMIGRDEELEILLRRWDQAGNGEGRVVLIWGEPGIGKSRLVAALEERIDEQQHVSLRYFCLPHRIDTALHPVVAQLEAAGRFEPEDDDATKLRKLSELVTPFSRDPARDLALLAELLSLPTEGGDRLALSAMRRKELLFECLIAQLVALAAARPVFMVLEDAHWIDPTTRELFDIAIERVKTLPILLVLTYRPEFKPSWLGQAHVTALTLSRLTRRDNTALVTTIAGEEQLPPAVVAEIVSRTDGVPLFVEEMTKAVLEGTVVRDAHQSLQFSTSASRERDVPMTLHASLVARFDRLPSARSLVQSTSALGREFTYAMARAVTDVPDAELESLLSELVAAELVHQRGSAPHSRYVFKHALVQDAAYATMLRNQRVATHRRIVEIIERDFPEEVMRHPDVLAHHCTAGELWEQAIEFRILANRVALDRSAGIEAQAQVEKGIALLSHLEPGIAKRDFEGRLQVALGDALTMTRGFAAPEVMTALLRARSLLSEEMHPIEALRALCGLFNYHLIRSESPLCLALAERWLERDLDRPTATVVHYLVGTANLHLGQFHRSIEHLEKALALYDERNCRPVALVAGYHVRPFTLIWLGLAYLYTGAIKRASDTISAAVSDARRRAHPFTLVSALLALARFCSHIYDHEGAVAATEEGLAIASEQRSPYHLSRGLILRAVNLIDGNRPLEGIAQMDQALAAHRATGANFQSSYNLSRLADANARAGNFERAMALAEEAIAEGERSGERWWEAEAERVRGEIVLLDNPHARAEAAACFDRALHCARTQGAGLWELRAAHSLARLWSLEERHREAHDLLCSVCAKFTDGFAFDDLERVKSAAVEAARRFH